MIDIKLVKYNNIIKDAKVGSTVVFNPNNE